MGRILKYKNQLGIKKCIHQSNTGIKAWALELGKM
jgi:hypothetical protein